MHICCGLHWDVSTYDMPHVKPPQRPGKPVLEHRCRTLMVTRCTGNVIGPLLYSPDQAPLYRKGLIADLCMFVVVGVVSA